MISNLLIKREKSELEAEALWHLGGLYSVDRRAVTAESNSEFTRLERWILSLHFHVNVFFDYSRRDNLGGRMTEQVTKASVR